MVYDDARNLHLQRRSAYRYLHGRISLARVARRPGVQRQQRQRHRDKGHTVEKLERCNGRDAANRDVQRMQLSGIFLHFLPACFHISHPGTAHRGEIKGRVQSPRNKRWHRNMTLSQFKNSLYRLPLFSTTVQPKRCSSGHAITSGVV